MRISNLLKSWALSTTAMLSASAAMAGTLTPLADYPGTPVGNTSILGINDNHEIVGNYTDAAGNTHGFYGQLGGTYTSFDIAPAGAGGGTIPRAIGPDGLIFGYSVADSGAISQSPEWEMSATGTVTYITKAGTQLFGIVQGDNSSGTFVGDYYHRIGNVLYRTAYIGNGSTWTSDIVLHGITSTREAARGINDSGEIVGWYTDQTAGLNRGWVINGGTQSIINYVVTDPNLVTQFGSAVTGTVLEGINNSGLITGFWFDNNNNPHTFLLSPDLTTFTDINVTGATYVQSFGVNNANEVLLTSDIGNFVYNPATSAGIPANTTVFLPLPGGTNTFAFQFNVVTGATFNIDPAIATGYDYKIGAGNPNFASVTPPSGVDGGLFDLIVCNGGTCTDTGILIAGGSTFDFTANGWAAGVSEFKLEGIDVSAGLDASNTTAFITGLTFTGAGAFTGTMSAITTCNGSFFVTGQTLNLSNTDVTGCQVTSNGGTLTANAPITIANAVQIDQYGLTVATNGTNVTLNGVVAGIGALGVSGTGTLTLGGINTYTGVTTISSPATLALTGTGSIASSANVIDNGTLDISGTTAGASLVSITGTGGINLGGKTLTLTNASGALSGAITGTGGIVLSAGNEMFGGTNTYSGGTRINGGALFVSADANLGATASTLTMGGGTLAATNSFSTARNVVLASTGIFDVAPGKSLTLGGSITGTGTLVKSDTGTLVISGADTATGGTTIASGTLSIGNGGSIGGNIIDNGALTFNRTGSLTYGGNITGGGSVAQTGSGLTIFNGVSSYTGGTTVSGGTLLIGDGSHGSASIAGSVMVNAGGTLGGHGSVNGAITNNGTVAPGGTVGTLTVASYTQGAGGNLALEISPPAASLLAVTGTANIAGTLTANFDAGTYGSAIYPLLTAGTLNGTFATFAHTGDPAGTVFGLSYQAKEVDLVIEPTASTAVFGDMTTATLEAGHQMGSTVLDRAHETCESHCGGYSFWINPYGRASRVSATGGLAGFRDTLGGVMAGVDYRVPGGSLIGITGGFGSDSIHTGGASSRGDAKSVAAGAYGATGFGQVRLSATVFYLGDTASVHRDTQGGPLANSKADGNGVFAAGEIDYTGLSHWFTPMAQLRYVDFSRKGFVESGAGVLDATIDARNANMLRGTFGARLMHEYESNGLHLEPTALFAVETDFTEPNVDATARLTSIAGTNFTTSSVKPDKTAGLVSLGLAAEAGQGVTLSVNFDGRFSSNQTQGSASAGVRIAL